MTRILITVAALLTIGASAPNNLMSDGGTDPAGPAPSPAIQARGTAADPSVVLDVPGRVAVSLTPRLVVLGADREESARLLDALARFHEHGLALPDLEVRFYDDEAECRGHYGLFQRSFEPWRVLICSDLQFVPTHELAHAWTAANLTDAERAGYIEARGLSNWNDPDAAWEDRGAEEAAFVIQQNLTATNPSLASGTWIDRIEAYELVTGQRSPLHGTT